MAGKFSLVIVLIWLPSLLIAVSCTKVREIQDLKKPKFALGEHVGPEFCRSCHEEIYDQWSRHSLHAVATSSESFLKLKDKFTHNILLNLMLGEKTCYACHGSKEVNQGVDCETCHGPVMPNVSIEETHEKRFKPGRIKLKKAGFCASCHTLMNVITTYSDWEKSEAGERGITCQDCHMRPRGGKYHYHGFDTALRNEHIYDGDVSIHGIKFDFPNLSLTVENRVAGHAIPAGGPSRILALEGSFIDSEGGEIHRVVTTFAKRFDLMPFAGLMPYKLIENTRLQSGEKRPVRFTLPAALEGKIAEIVLILRFYEVSDEHRGDIEKAHWVGEPILEKRIRL
jgi:hypothetical protein